MLVGDVLQLVGTLRLDQFEWGPGFVEVCNRKLESHTTNRLYTFRVTMTGAEVRDGLYRLPVKEMTEFLLRDFDVVRQTLSPVSAANHSAIKPTTLTLKKKKNDASTVKVTFKPKTKSWALVIGGLLVIVALLVAISMSSAHHEPSQVSGDEANKDIESMADIITEIFLTYLQGDKKQKGP